METEVGQLHAGKLELRALWRRNATLLIQNGNRYEFSKSLRGIPRLAATISCVGHRMSENLLQTLQQLVQDVIAPDVRELKARVSSLEKQMDVRFDAVDVRFDAVDTRFNALEQKTETRFSALEQKMDAQFKAILAAIGESKAQSELITTRLLAPLSERAVLEALRR